MMMKRICARFAPTKNFIRGDTYPFILTEYMTNITDRLGVFDNRYVYALEGILEPVKLLAGMLS